MCRYHVQNLFFLLSSTGQPQSRVTVRTPPTSKRHPLLQNGAGPLLDLSSSNGEARNGVVCSELGSLASSQKPHRKLQSHHSINSQISKKSKGSSKYASSQIPTEAQEGTYALQLLSKSMFVPPVLQINVQIVECMVEYVIMKAPMSLVTS